MPALLLMVAASFLFALILTPLLRDFFKRRGVLDYPDQERKLHPGPVPHLGGVPIVLAYLLAVAALPLFGTDAAGALELLLKLAPGAAIVFASGVFDDIYGLQPAQKLCAHVAAAASAYLAGVRIAGPASFALPAWLGAIVTIVWIAGCTNALNLIDGVDGLAAGVGVCAAAATMIAALLGGNLSLAIVAAPLVGALLGFLRYNFHPATIFPGDSGSLWIGFLLGGFGAIWMQHASTVWGMTAPLLALAIPLLDAGLTIVRRSLRRQPIFRGDCAHIHHRLLARGFTPRGAVLLLYAFSILGAALSIVQTVSSG